MDRSRLGIAAFTSKKAWRCHLRTTHEGKAFIMVTVGLGSPAFNTGNNLLFLILGFMLSLIVLSGVMSETAIRGLHVTRRLPKGRSPAKCAWSNSCCTTRRPPSYSLEIEDLANHPP